ncbi:MAG: hypothetical protein AAFZ58_02045 [Pseudomonadota bacterium]
MTVARTQKSTVGQCLVPIAMMLSVLAIGCTVSGNGRAPDGAIEVAVDPSRVDSPVLELTLSQFLAVPGVVTRYSLLQTRRSSGKYSGGRGQQSRNVLFLSGAQSSAHWLFEHQRFRVLSIEALTIRSMNTDEPPRARALLAEIVKEDTDADGSLTDRDDRTIALLRTDGQGYTEIMTVSSPILLREIRGRAASIDFYYQDDRQLAHKRFSLQTFGLEFERVVTEF